VPCSYQMLREVVHHEICKMSAAIPTGALPLSIASQNDIRV